MRTTKVGILKASRCRCHKRCPASHAVECLDLEGVPMPLVITLARRVKFCNIRQAAGP
jgi:hypothetical protein